MILYILTVAVIVLIIAMFIVAWNVYLDNLSTQRLCDAVFRLCSKMDEKPKKPRSELLSGGDFDGDVLGQVQQDVSEQIRQILRDTDNRKINISPYLAYYEQLKKEDNQNG